MLLLTSHRSHLRNSQDLGSQLPESHSQLLSQLHRGENQTLRDRPTNLPASNTPFGRQHPEEVADGAEAPSAND